MAKSGYHHHRARPSGGSSAVSSTMPPGLAFSFSSIKPSDSGRGPRSNLTSHTCARAQVHNSEPLATRLQPNCNPVKKRGNPVKKKGNPVKKTGKTQRCAPSRERRAPSRNVGLRNRRRMQSVVAVNPDANPGCRTLCSHVRLPMPAKHTWAVRLLPQPQPVSAWHP